MATLIVTPLNNGITSTLVGMACLNGVESSYIYWDTLGDVYYQSNGATPATLVLSAGFAITCIDTIFDGTVFTIFFGGVGGNYVLGTIDLTGISTLAVFSSGTIDFTSCVFNILTWSFVIGTIDGKILNLDLTTSVVTQLIQLNAPNLPSGSTLKISSITYDVILDKFLIIGIADTNINPDYTDPLDVAAKAITNYSSAYYGTLNDLNFSEFIGKNLNLGAIGWVENSNNIKEIKIIIAGESCVIYNSSNGITWNLSIVDQAVQINSLTFNTWVFVAGLIYGMVLMSTNGIVWETSFDQLLINDLIDVKKV